MKFSGKMYLRIISNVTKNWGFTLSLKDTFFDVLGLNACCLRIRIRMLHYTETQFFAHVIEFLLLFLDDNVNEECE